MKKFIFNIFKKEIRMKIAMILSRHFLIILILVIKWFYILQNNHNITFFNHILFVMKNKFYVLNLKIENIMRKINPQSSSEDSFKYSILISLHCYIYFHPERISQLKQFENNYNFTEISPNEFETTNPNISLTILDENKNKIYVTKIDSANKAQIVKWENNDRYAALKRLKNKFVKLDEILGSFSQKELKEYLINGIATLK